MAPFLRIAVLGLSAGLLIVLAGAAVTPQENPPPAPDPLEALGHEVTSGAAPGYVDSKLCGLCHQEEYVSYQEVGMARSFYSPATAQERGWWIEDFDAPPTFHEASRRWYRIERGDGGRLHFRRWQKDAEGEQHPTEPKMDPDRFLPRRGAPP